MFVMRIILDLCYSLNTSRDLDVSEFSLGHRGPCLASPAGDAGTPCNAKHAPISVYFNVISVIRRAGGDALDGTADERLPPTDVIRNCVALCVTDCAPTAAPSSHGRALINHAPMPKIADGWDSTAPKTLRWPAMQRRFGNASHSQCHLYPRERSSSAR